MQEIKRMSLRLPVNTWEALIKEASERCTSAHAIMVECLQEHTGTLPLVSEEEQEQFVCVDPRRGIYKKIRFAN